MDAGLSPLTLEAGGPRRVLLGGVSPEEVSWYQSPEGQVVLGRRLL